MKPFGKYFFLLSLLLLLIHCNKDNVVNDNCIIKKTDTLYSVSDFSNILKNQYTNTKYKISIKNILSKKIKNGNYEIRIYINGDINNYLDKIKYKFFIYMYPEDKNIIDLPNNRKKFRFDVWESNIKFKTDKNNKKYVEMFISSKLDFYEFIAFGIINKENYKRLFVIQEKNIKLN